MTQVRVYRCEQTKLKPYGSKLVRCRNRAKFIITDEQRYSPYNGKSVCGLHERMILKRCPTATSVEIEDEE